MSDYTTYYVKLQDETFADAERIEARSEEAAKMRGALFMFSELGDYDVAGIELLDDAGNLLATYDAYVSVVDS